MFRTIWRWYRLSGARALIAYVYPIPVFFLLCALAFFYASRNYGLSDNVTTVLWVLTVGSAITQIVWRNLSSTTQHKLLHRAGLTAKDLD